MTSALPEPLVPASCPACAQPDSGHYTTGCRACGIRLLARSHLFFEAMRAGRLTPAYRAALRALGGDEAAVHLEVKAVAKGIVMGATRA